MGITVSAISSNIGLWDYINQPNNIEVHFIGHIGESFNSENNSILDEKIKQFKFITIMAETIFNTKQLQELSKEIPIVEELNIINKEDLEVIKNGIKVALEKNLYLKFECD